MTFDVYTEFLHITRPDPLRPKPKPTAHLRPSRSGHRLGSGLDLRGLVMTTTLLIDVKIF